MSQYNYEGLLESMHKNVVDLQKKLNDLDKVYQDISNLKNSASGIPKEFQGKFDAIVATSNEYMTSISGSVKKYLDGNNGVLTANMNDLGAKINTIATQTSDFQTKINAFGSEVNRISKVDLEVGFRSLQDTLSQIFQAIQGININLTSLSTTINTITNTINSGFNRLEKTVTSAKNDIHTQMKSSDEILLQNIEMLQIETEKLKSSNKTNQILMIASILLSIGILAVLFFK